MLLLLLNNKNNSPTDTYKEINNIPAKYIIDKNIRDLKTEFRIHNIPIYNDRFPNIYWMSKIHISAIKKTPKNLDL